MAQRNAILSTATVEVVCPHCGEPQPAPDNGSHLWMPSQLSAESERVQYKDGRKMGAGVRECVSCDETFRVISHNRAQVAS